ncbi:glycosyltransferase family 2 protein [Oceanibaculum indicum]|uniref:Glycosyl transferase family 2 n=1 Tax=Oceanibaculum indicum TaxID=526216 RepID=A0A420WAG6_9PROT|nr:glycosyltransferase [Oceanibaculum indicum]RKQ67940.1 glycosyl transferase family 2 [Oceanibaculum indicum]
MPEAAVAIITRTKDRPLLLRRAVESVLGQTHTDWVHVIVNDGGDPAAVEQVVAPHAERYAGRLVRVDNPQSLGMEAASNRGIAASTSRYLVIHDDDDSWDPAFLEKMTALLETSRPPVAGAICHSVLVHEAIESESVKEQRREDFNASLLAVPLAQMAVRNLFPPISFLFQRAALEAAGPFREELPVLGDWDFNLRFLRDHDIAVLPEKLAFWHHRVAAAEGGYANSVLGGALSHASYDAAIRNQLLREDLEKGRVGLGFLVNFGTAVRDEIHASAPGSLIEARAAPALRLIIDEARNKAQAAEIALQQSQQRQQTMETLAQDLNQRLEAVHRSTSWQVTAPLRWAIRMAKRLTGRR